MKKLLLVFFLAPLLLFGQKSPVERQQDSIVALQKQIAGIEARMEASKLLEYRKVIKEYGLPSLQPSQQLIEHSAMFLVYSEAHEQALWVAHRLTKDVLQGNEGRSNDFRPDPMIATGSAVQDDYFMVKSFGDGQQRYDGFGYDRGHLAPSADFRWSKKALSESYFYSNMSPQVADFNRDSWAKLEDKFRAYIVANPTGDLLLVTGPVLTDTLQKIERGTNHVSIPKRYYKMAIDLTAKTAVAFLMPNEKAKKGYASYAVSIDEIEALTGLDFYANLPDSLENRLEAMNDPSAFLSASEMKDVEPVDPTTLSRNEFNTVQAQLYMNQNKRVTIVGTVVGSKKSSKGNVFLNLDRAFPNQTFTVSIFSHSMTNFSYDPSEAFNGKLIAVTGIITEYNGKPSIVIDNEKSIQLYIEEGETIFGE